MNENKYWNEHAANVNEYYYNYRTGVVKADLLINKIMKLLVDVTGKSILKTDMYEDAFGSDQLINRTEFDGAKITGMDISLKVTLLAKQKGGTDSHSYANCDVTNLCYKDSEFDVVLSVSTLDHFDSVTDFKKSVDELVRVLKPGGKFLLILDNRYSLFNNVNLLKKLLNVLPFRMGKTYTAKEVSKLFAERGIKIISEEYGLYTPINYFPRFFNMLSEKYPERFQGIIGKMECLFEKFFGRLAASFNFILIEKV